MRSHPLFRRSVQVLILPLALIAGCQRQSPNANGAAAGSPSALGAGVRSASASDVPSTPAPFATPPLLAGTPDIAALVARVKPSVVNITITHDAHPAKLDDSSPFGPFGSPPFGIQPFGPFGPGRRGENPIFRQKALGS